MLRGMKKLILIFAVFSVVALSNACTDTFDEEFQELHTGDNENNSPLSGGDRPPEEPE